MTCSVFKNMRSGPRGSPNWREGGPVQRAAWTASVECEGQSFQRHLITGRPAGAQGSGWGFCPRESKTRWPSIQRWSPGKDRFPGPLQPPHSPTKCYRDAPSPLPAPLSPAAPTLGAPAALVCRLPGQSELLPVPGPVHMLLRLCLLCSSGTFIRELL